MISIRLATPYIERQPGGDAGDDLRFDDKSEILPRHEHWSERADSQSTHRIWHAAVPADEFSRLRREAPVAWNERDDGHKGFWAVTRFADIVTVAGNVNV